MILHVAFSCVSIAVVLQWLVITVTYFHCVLYVFSMKDTTSQAGERKHIFDFSCLKNVADDLIDVWTCKTRCRTKNVFVKHLIIQNKMI